MITIWLASWISVRIVSLQPDTDIQKLLSNGNRIRIQISEKLLSIFWGFRQTFGKSCTLHNHSFIIYRSIFSAFYAMIPRLSSRDEHGSGLDRTGSGLKPIWPDRFGSDWENFCCFMWFIFFSQDCWRGEQNNTAQGVYRKYKKTCWRQ